MFHLQSSISKSKWALLPLCLLLSVHMTAKEAKIASPNGKLVVTVNDDGGLATYSVSLNGQPVLMPSRLGFKADFGDFTQGLSITESSQGNATGDYSMRQVKQSHISFKASRMLVTFQNNRNQKMQVDFFVKDNDIAFRYIIPRQQRDNPKCAVITEEVTSFCPPDGTTTFISPQIDPIGWLVQLARHEN